MKKIIPALLIICAAFSTNSIKAQYCGNSGPSACTPNGSVNGQGFENNDSIPCIVQDTAYNNAAQFNMYTSFNFLGQQTVDSIQFITITNLPCGMCWSTSHANNLFKASDVGCMNFSGTTTDAIGQYHLNMTLKAWINGSSTPETITPSLVDSAGINLYLRVRAGGTTSCAAVNSSNPSNTAATNCPALGINDVAMNISAMSIVPNPMNNASQLSFTSIEKATYLLRITNIAGQVLSVKEINAVNGVNTTTIERGTLSAGIYLVNLSNGNTSITKKLTILE